MSQRKILVVGYKSMYDRTYDKDGELLGEFTDAKELDEFISKTHGYFLNYFRDSNDMKGLEVPSVYLYLDGTRD